MGERNAQYTVSQLKATEKVKEADKNTELNPQLKRIVWVRHLKNKDPERLLAKNLNYSQLVRILGKTQATAEHRLSNP